MKKIANRILNPSQRTRYGILVSLVVLALQIASQYSLLESVHSDVPIYLYQAKRFAETHYLTDYIKHAATVAEQVSGNWPDDELYSHAYWHFIRLGHIIVLGEIVSIFGSSLTAIAVSSWLYTILVISGVLFSFLITLILGKDKEPMRPWFVGAAISMLLFFISYIYRYLAGNLVSEVLCVFLVNISVLLFVISFNNNSLKLACLSGLIAFLSYVCRVEAILSWLGFLIAYALTWRIEIQQTKSWKIILIATISAFAAYLLYAAIFYPLADPRLYMAFTSTLRNITPTYEAATAYKTIFVVGGLLWPGSIVSALRGSHSNMARFGWLWLLITALPWLPQVLFGGPCQARMMASLITPLLLLSSLGWCILLEYDIRNFKRLISGLCLVIAVISQPTVHAMLREIPGVWRVQLLIDPLVFPKKFERFDAMPTEIENLSQVIYKNKEPTILVLNSNISPYLLNMIRYFGSSYLADSDLILMGDPVNEKVCNQKHPTLQEPVVYCQGYTVPEIKDLDTKRYRVLHLRQGNFPSDVGDTILLKTNNFTLDMR